MKGPVIYMNINSAWCELAAQQLVRYEALFKLLDDIQGLEEICSISDCVAKQWKYFAGVSSWRLVVFQECGNLVIDGFRGKAHITEVAALPPWDAYHKSLQRPRSILKGEAFSGPSPPDHLEGKRIEEIRVHPFMRAGRWIALLSAAARHEPFSELDIKFLRIFGNHFSDRIFNILFRRRTTEELVQRATRDALTGLYNRGAIIERLEGQMALAKRTGHPLSVIIADIDYFKIINDTHGHLAGDEVLREVSSRLTAQIRESDSLGRFGGEEFLFVLFPCSVETVVKAAERFRRSIADTPVFAGETLHCKVDVTISLGTASVVGHSNVSVNALLKQADDALYHSKFGGRNCVTIGDTIL